MQVLRFVGFLTLAVGLAACERGGTNETARNQQGSSGASAGNTGSGTATAGGAGDKRVLPGELAPSGTSGTPAGSPNGTEPSLEHFAMMASHAEIEIGRLALQKARNPQVKQFAQQMVTDHTKAMTQLEKIGGAAPHQPATTRDATERHQLDADHQQLYDRLNGLSGDEFDREYMRAMVADHQTAVARFHQAKGADARTTTTTGTKTSDTPAGTTGRSDETKTGRPGEITVNRWAEQTLPTLRKHLDGAQQILSRLEQPRGR